VNLKHISIFLFLLLSAAVFQGCKDSSTEPPQKSNRMTLVGSYNTPGYASGISLKKINNINYAFVADGTSGLQVLNVNFPNSPVYAGAYTAGGINTLDVTTATVNSIQYAFLSNGNQGFSIIDVSTPSTPVLDTTVILGNDRVLTSFVDTTNRIAYFGSFYGRVYIYDISGLPVAINQLAIYSTIDNVLGIHVVSGLAYLAENTVGLEILNVNNPSQPAYVGSFDTPGNSNDIKVSGIYAYIADGSSLMTINVSNPFTPAFSSSVTTEGANYFGVALNAPTQLFTADAAYGVETFGIGVPSSPQQIGFYNTDGIAASVAYLSGYIYLADGADGVIILRYQQ
jgi:hypothetical protein